MRTETIEQPKLFNQKIELEKVDSVIVSGYEKQVAELAILDKVNLIGNLYLILFLPH